MKISVCMATYNGERFVKEQLESILSELSSYPDDAEIVIADDGSVDNTLDVFSAIGDSRIRVLPPRTGNAPLGPTYNFERALKAATGDIIFLSDQDDRWLPGKVQSMLTALDGNAVLAVHDACFIDGEGGELPALKTMWSNRPYKAGLFRNWLKNTYTGCCMAFRRELLSKALPFPKNLPMHDQWLGLVAERNFGGARVVPVNRQLIQYRVHEKNATQLVGGKSCGWFQRMRWRIDLLRALLG